MQNHLIDEAAGLEIKKANNLEELVKILKQRLLAFEKLRQYYIAHNWMTDILDTEAKITEIKTILKILGK